MHDMSYFCNSLKFIYSSFRSLSSQIWSNNLSLLLNDFVLTYHLEKVVNIDSVKELPYKEQYEFVKALVNSYNSDCLALPKWEYDNISLIMRADQMLSVQSPFEFNFVTMFNSDGYEVGKWGYTENRDAYIIAISEIDYNGLWKDLKDQLTQKIAQCNFDVKFINNNDSFVIPKNDISLQLDWPWRYPKDDELINSNVLIEIVIKKGIHKELGSAFNYWVSMIAQWS